ncbi:MAG: membrane protein insertase YidC [Bacteroidia bacterium]|nr:membrane protein insertase YidC [Bacteroidia bacterium]
MDRNSAIGLTLIAALLLVYFTYFGPKPETVQPNPITTETRDSVNRQAVSTQVQELTKTDSSLIRQYGNLSSLLSGEEKITKLETTDLAIQFSSRGGMIKELELRNFKTYSGKALMLVTPASNSTSLITQYEGKDVDLTKLYYTTDQRNNGDTTVLIFTARISDAAFIKQTYKIPTSGFEIGYKLDATGLALAGQNITLLWKDKIPLMEKDITDSRTKSTINYFTTAGDSDGLSETSTDLETDALATPIKWVAIRKKFFINSIIAKKHFAGGEVSTVANIADTAIVKEATIKLFIPGADVAAGAEFRYYFGPNDYDIITKVTEGFSDNLSFGWPPMSWITKYLLIPVFQFLERFVGSYGIIIVLLVLFVKILLLPLSYKSYLGMAKMKLLKPELDLIKEKNGDNMTQNQQDQMKLYQQAGVNPFSGCIPLLLQMPILFAMFWFFPMAIQLRQQPFLWAEDLSTYDSIASLPFTIPFYGDHVSLFVLLMTASTLIYQWQNNQLQSVQGPMKSMGYIMPIIFLFVLNNFSAGLSFYYFISNLITFAQQAIIKRFVDEDKIIAVMDDHKKKMEATVAAGGKKSGFMSKLEQAMKTSEEARRKKK